MFIKKIEKKIRVQATGEMTPEDLRPGGDFHEAAQKLAKVAKETKLFVAVKPFDVYQGPFALLKTGDRIWLTDSPGKYYVELMSKNAMKGHGFEGSAAMIKKFYAHLKPTKPAYKHLRLVK